MNTDEPQVLTDVQLAYVSWKSLFPAVTWVEERTISYHNDLRAKTFREPAHYDGKCCVFEHHGKDDTGNWVIFPDDKVCARERAWRKYIRLRDGAPVTTH